MVEEQLINWIKESQSRGYSIGYIKDYLISHGYDKQLTEDALREFSDQKLSTPFPSENEGFGFSKNKLWIIGGSVLFLGAILLLVMLLGSSNQLSPAPELTQGCVESWICNDLNSPGECIEGKRQIKICVDSNQCGTVKNKPSGYETCNIEEISGTLERGVTRSYASVHGMYDIKVARMGSNNASFVVNGFETDVLNIGKEYDFSDGSKIVLKGIDYSNEKVEFTLIFASA